MTPLEMIAEWRKGCTVAGPLFNTIIEKDGKTSPAGCIECTEGLISALVPALQRQERSRDLWRGLAIVLAGYSLAQTGIALLGMISR